MLSFKNKLAIFLTAPTNRYELNSPSNLGAVLDDDLDINHQHEIFSGETLLNL